MKSRQESRWNLLLFLPVYNQKDGAFLGYIADIASHGVLVFSAEHIELGSKYILEIRHTDLSEALLDKNIEGNIACRVSSRWVDLDVKPDFHRTGFMFMEMSADDEKKVRQLIQNVANSLSV